MLLLSLLLLDSRILNENGTHRIKIEPFSLDKVKVKVKANENKKAGQKFHKITIRK